MKKYPFLEYNYSVILSCLDLIACVKELGGLESTPQTNFVEKAGGLKKQLGGVQPANPRQLNHWILAIWRLLIGRRCVMHIGPDIGLSL